MGGDRAYLVFRKCNAHVVVVAVVEHIDRFPTKLCNATGTHGQRTRRQKDKQKGEQDRPWCRSKPRFNRCSRGFERSCRQSGPRRREFMIATVLTLTRRIAFQFATVHADRGITCDRSKEATCVFVRVYANYVRVRLGRRWAQKLGWLHKRTLRRSQSTTSRGPIIDATLASKVPDYDKRYRTAGRVGPACGR